MALRIDKINLKATDVAALPVYGLITAGTNLNTLDGSVYGKYWQSENANSPTSLNYPVAAAGTLLVLKNNASNLATSCTQIYLPYNSNEMYSRSFYSSWTAWSRVAIIDMKGANSTIKSLTGLTTALSIEQGGTGATNAAGARRNIGLDAFYTTGESGDSRVLNPANPNQYFYINSQGVWGAYDISANKSIPLGVGNGGTGATNPADARSTLGLGPNNDVTFKGISVNRGVANESGYITLPALDAKKATISSSKIYNEYKNGRAATVIATQGPSSTYYLQYTEQGVLEGVTQFKSTPGTGFINQGGENNNIEIAAPQAIPPDTWSGYMRFRWYSDYVNIGAVRGGSNGIDSYAIEVLKSGDDTTTYKFFPQGYMTARAYNGRCTAGAYGLEFSPTGNSVPFNARNAPNNNGGWVPIVAGGSETPQGYGLRVALGATSPGVSGWGTAMVKMMGDNNKHRAYSFDVTGGISTWASDNDGTWGANYDFTKSPTSDRDLKEDIVYTNGVESFNRVMQWLPTLFKYKGSTTQRFGLIAQDLLKVDPQYVRLVPGSPVFEDVIGVDANGEEYVHHQIETDRRDDTLALDSNVMLVDMACAMVYMGNRMYEMEERLAKLESLLYAK